MSIDTKAAEFAQAELNSIVGNLVAEFPAIKEQCEGLAFAYPFETLTSAGVKAEGDPLAKTFPTMAEAMVAFRHELSAYLAVKVSGDCRLLWRDPPHVGEASAGGYSVSSRLIVLPIEEDQPQEEAQPEDDRPRRPPLEIEDLGDAVALMEKILPAFNPAEHEGFGFGDEITIYSGGGKPKKGESPVLYLSRAQAIAALVQEFDWIVVEDQPAAFELVDGSLVVDQWLTTITDSKNCHRVASVRFSAQMKVRFAG